MSFMAGVWRILGAEDEDTAQQRIVEYPAPENRQSAARAEAQDAGVLALAESQPNRTSTLFVARPALDEDGESLFSLKEYAGFLLSESAVVLDVNEVAAQDDQHATRIVDYLTGVVEAVGGRVFEMTTNVFIFTPSSVELAGDPVTQIEVN